MDVQIPATLSELLQRSARNNPNRPALAAAGGRSLTYLELTALVAATCNKLVAACVAPGDRVAILSENRPEWGIAYFAIHACGAVAVPILPDFHPTEIQNILRHAECVAAFISAKLQPKIEGASLPSLQTVLAIEHLSEQETADLDASPDRILPPPSVTADSLAAIVYTSGTTGFSKGVMLSHRNIISNAAGVVQMVHVYNTDRMLSILPLAHTYECTLGLVTPLLLGAAVYYLDRPPSAGVLLPAMAAVRPTIILSVPLIIEKIYKAKIQPELSRPLFQRLLSFGPTRSLLLGLIGRRLLKTFGGELRLFCIGGAPLAADVEQFLREAGFPYAIGYGLTETSPLISGDDAAHTRFRAVGRTLPGIDLRIDTPNPSTGEGEIVVHGPNIMLGYYKDPERTADVLSPDGWLRTGDLGCIDADGYVYIKGRLKSLILGPSGKNIYPEEIESALNEFDLVLESVVFQQQNKLIARAHLNYEELKRRFGLDNQPEHQIREYIAKFLEDLRRQVNERLAHFSRLHRIIEQAEPFEKTPTQKIKRHLYQS